MIIKIKKVVKNRRVANKKSNKRVNYKTKTHQMLKINLFKKS